MISVPDLGKLILHEDAINLLCGKLIGQGSTRKVFDCTLLPGYVVKIEDDPSSFANIAEHTVWQDIQHTEHSKWFAQVHTMSCNGRILIMEKTVRPGPNDWPDKLPVYLTDRKCDNYGISVLADPKSGKVPNKLVCHDYGLHNLLTTGLTKRMNKAEWWDQ